LGCKKSKFSDASGSGLTPVSQHQNRAIIRSFHDALASKALMKFPQKKKWKEYLE
jgi:hypothetical protein